MRSQKSRTLAAWAAEVRRRLAAEGSPKRAAGIRWFFKEEVRSHGWRTGDLRRLARRLRKDVLAASSLDRLLACAENLFRGDVLEEKVVAVLLLERDVESFGEREFRRFERWLPRISSWADHDALVYYLIAPLVAADAHRVRRAKAWARSRNRWHRRAAAVSLIRLARRDGFTPPIGQVAGVLVADPDDMVQKGVGWLLREFAKADPAHTVPYLLRIRPRASRLVLRTACETLPAASRRVLQSPRRLQ